jgi:hypothetical protein
MSAAVSGRCIIFIGGGEGLAAKLLVSVRRFASGVCGSTSARVIRSTMKRRDQALDRRRQARAADMLRIAPGDCVIRLPIHSCCAQFRACPDHSSGTIKPREHSINR